MLAFSIAIAISLFVFIMMTLIVLRQSDSQREMQRRLDQFMDPSAAEEMVDLDDLRKIPFLQRTVGRVLGDLMDTLSYFAPAAIPKLMERRIMLAGKQGVWKVAHFAGLWFLCLALGFALGFWYAGRGVYTAPQFFLIVLGWGFMGALLPFGVLNHIIKKRQSLIMQQLPDVLDLLAISVQAGLSFDAALRKVVERMKGPLIDELSRMLRDVRMGMTRRRSMQFMAKRCDVQDVYLFVMSVTQSERLGASMSDTLTIQADNMRNVRRQRARTKAMKAPVKMVFPLVFCIFPAIFVVALLPSILSLMETMGKK